MLLWRKVDALPMAMVNPKLRGTPRFVAGCIIWRTNRCYIVVLLLHINNQDCVSSTIEVVSYEEESFIGVRAGKGKGFDSKKAKVSTHNHLP
jgi:hypothetical protein